MSTNDEFLGQFLGQFLGPAEAARRLGLSTKALRLYEQRGLITPTRTEAGWRAYGPSEMRRAAEIAHLRRLGLNLAQVGRVLAGDAVELEKILQSHHAALERQVLDLTSAMTRVQHMRRDLAAGAAPEPADLIRQLATQPEHPVTFDLPWPWDGERFTVPDLAPLTFITGPLGSGKTRLLHRLAQALPDATFLPLTRLDDAAQKPPAPATSDAEPSSRQAATLAWLIDEGAIPSDALSILIAALENDEAKVVLIDMIEEGLDAATQAALMAHLRRRRLDACNVIALTRSTGILDLTLAANDEVIIYCPANHSPPMLVAPHDGAIGYEAVATCLASPEVRARTAGVIAWRPQAG